MTDAQLVQAVLAGDRDRFAELVGRYQGMVYGLAWHLSGSHSDAQDIAQQAFVAAYSRLEQLANPDRFPAWLRRITVNECRMWGRKQQAILSWENLPPLADPSAESPAQAAEKAELRQRVHRAIAALPEAQRLAVRLFYLDGMSCEEVGRFLGVPVGAVKGRLHRARSQLKEALMDAVEEVLQEEKPGREFTQAVQRSVPVRHVEPFELSVPVSPTDTVLIYTHDAVVQVQGSDGDVLRVEGRKILFGATAEEARARAGQIAASAGRRRDLWSQAPYQGDRWAGVNTQDGREFVAHYTDSQQEWEAWRARWQQDEVLGHLLPGLLSGDVATVVAAGRHIEGITVPYPLEGDAAQEFRPGYSSGRGGWAFGPAARVALTVSVPPCAHVILFTPAQATLERLPADLLVIGEAASFTAREIGGRVFAYGAVPTQVGHVSGDVWVDDPQDHRGVEWEEKAIRRVGDPPAVRLRGVQGAAQVRCRCLDLDVADVSGDISIANDFGRTRLKLGDTWPAGRTADVESAAGTVHLTLSPQADDRLSVGIRTECGRIERARWRTSGAMYAHNTPEVIYLGTKPEQEAADVRIRTRSGDVRVVRR